MIPRNSSYGNQNESNPKDASLCTKQKQGTNIIWNLAQSTTKYCEYSETASIVTIPSKLLDSNDIPQLSHFVGDSQDLNGVDTICEAKNNTQIPTTQNESKWLRRRHSLTKSNRPPLRIILNDQVLLHALITHTTKAYNVENILFLQHVNELKNIILTNDDDIDSKIVSLYTLYINPSAEYAINLSFDSLCDIRSKRNTYTEFNYDQKRSMFDLCANEIKHLTISSILPSFYRSAVFQRIPECYSTQQQRRQPKKNENMKRKIRSFAARASNRNLPRIQLPVETAHASPSYGAQLTTRCTPESDHIWNISMPTHSEIKVYRNRSPSSVSSVPSASASPLSPSISILHSLTDISPDCGCDVEIAEEPKT